MSDRVATAFGFESIAVLPVRSTPSMTSLRGLEPESVVTPSLVATCCAGNSCSASRRCADDRCGGVQFDDHVDGFAAPDRYVLGHRGRPRGTPPWQHPMSASRPSDVGDPVAQG